MNSKEFFGEQRNLENRQVIFDRDIRVQNREGDGDIFHSERRECVECGIAAVSEDMEEIEGSWFCFECKKVI